MFFISYLPHDCVCVCVGVCVCVFCVCDVCVVEKQRVVLKEYNYIHASYVDVSDMRAYMMLTHVCVCLVHVYVHV